MLYNRTLFVHFVCNSLHLLISNPHSIPLHLTFSLANASLFFMSNNSYYNRKIVVDVIKIIIREMLPTILFWGRGVVGCFPGGSDSKSVCLQCWRPRFIPWVRKIPWRRKWQPTAVLLPGKPTRLQSMEPQSQT